jgi:flap endonuclease-1
MGVQLGALAVKKEIGLEDLRGKTLAVDASSIIHQFLALVRYPTGVPLMDKEGHVTSSLAGLFYRSTKLIYRHGIELIFVLDGKRPSIKFAWLNKGEREKRRQRFERTLREWKEALDQGDLRTAHSKAVTTGMIDSDIIKDAKRLLFLLGIPVVQAPGEAEAQAAHIAKRGRAWAVNSRDFDSLLFGAPRMARYVSIAGVYRGIGMPSRPEVFELKSVLQHLGITQTQFMEMAILMGTDYNRGLKGVGPKTALKLVRRHGSLDKMPPEIALGLPANLEEIRKNFKDPRVDKKYSLVSGEFDPEGIVGFLCGERGFREKSVRSITSRMIRAEALGNQSSLDRWAPR